MAYPLPPWLSPKSDPAQEFGQSFRQATQIAGQMQMESARLQAAAQQAEQELAAKRAESEQRAAREQQELAQTKAFHDAQIGLKQQELEQGQQELQMKTQIAARKFQAQTAFEREVGDASDPERVVRAMQKYGTAMGEPGAAMAAAMRAAQTKAAFVPGPVQSYPMLDAQGNPVKGARAYLSPTGKGMDVHFEQQQREFGAKEQAQIRQINIDAKDILAKYPLGIERAKPKTPEQEAVVRNDKAKLEALRRKAEQILGTGDVGAELPEGEEPEGAPAAGVAPPAAGPRPPAAAPTRVRVVSMSRGGQPIPIVRATSPPHDEPGMTEAGTPEAPYVAKDKLGRRLPNLDFKTYVAATKTDYSKAEDATKALGQLIADKIGPTGAYVGGTPWRHKTGSVFSDVLLKGRSAKLPALSQKQLVDWINNLSPSDRTQLLYDALDEAGYVTGDLFKYPEKSRAAQPEQKVAAGYE